jgi:hypothetical protein
LDVRQPELVGVDLCPGKNGKPLGVKDDQAGRAGGGEIVCSLRPHELVGMSLLLERILDELKKVEQERGGSRARLKINLRTCLPECRSPRDMDRDSTSDSCGSIL